MAARCFWPPESVTPRSPTMVSKPCGNSSNSSANVRGLGSLKQFFGAGIGRAKGQVFANGLAEEESLLRNHADIAAQNRQRIIAHRPAIDQQRAFGRFIEARNQIDERGFAAAGGANDGQARARGNVQRNIAQHLGAPVSP